MVLCAGFGTRLRPMTEWVAKPLVPVGNAPVLGHILQSAAQNGVSSAVVNAHHLAPQFSEHARDIAGQSRVELAVSEEVEILGTAGGVRAASHLLDGAAVIWNGDILLEPALQQLQALGEAHGICLLAAPTKQQGTLGVDRDGNVCRLRGHRFGVEVERMDYVGLMSLSKSWRERLPLRGCLIGDFILPSLLRGSRVPVLRHTGGWRDIGTLSEYMRANLDWAAARGGAFVARTASLASGLRVERSVVMSGARISGTGVLEDCIVWPNAEARAPLQRTIIAEQGTIHVPHST